MKRVPILTPLADALLRHAIDMDLANGWGRPVVSLRRLYVDGIVRPLMNAVEWIEERLL